MFIVPLGQMLPPREADYGPKCIPGSIVRFNCLTHSLLSPSQILRGRRWIERRRRGNENEVFTEILSSHNQCKRRKIGSSSVAGRFNVGAPL